MKLLLINTSDIGGAGKACVRLHQGLLSMNVDAKLLLAKKTANHENSFLLKPKEDHSLKNKIKKKSIKILRELKLLKTPKKTKEQLFVENRALGLELYSFPNSNYDITESPLYKQADIINLHWVSGFIDYESFFKKNTKPVVWTLHDMNPFTGGEHYKETFLGIDENGFPKKRVLTNEEILQFKKILNLKKEALSQVKNLHFVTLSDWMTYELQQSDFFGKFPVHKIPNGISSKVFKPRDKRYSRELLNIPLDKKVILFVADLIHANRKGFKFLVEAINKLEQENVQLFVIGNKNESLYNFKNIIQYGVVKDDRLLSSIYSAADVFVIPSLMDNLPNTVLESLLCGTPVIGYPIGGIPDMVSHGENGLISESVSVDALANSINQFLSNGVLFSTEEIRKQAVIKYDDKVQAKNYMRLFKSLVN
ncbi:glycosyltransferase [uncultured Algibacter sp.]|uniref:glycosyltransferase n=1 Tax=uncultured Algibacter sp. TaxID=298659 RepID=UPI0026268DF0|nr:glycosyltransferase [uncultured Algibacter sp.]